MINSVLPIFKPGSGCDFHRVIMPLSHMGVSMHREKFNTETFKGVKAVYFNRILAKLSIDGLKQLKSIYGFKIVMDVDDYWHLYPNHYLYKQWKLDGIPKKIEELIKIADAIPCPTERLATEIRLLNPNVYVIPNAIPFEGQFIRNEQDYTGKGTRFGFVGGTSHLGDIRTITPIFEHFSDLNFTYAGYTGHGVSERMHNTCSNWGKNQSYKTIDMMPLNRYMSAYDTLDCCIAPLMDEHFNKFKSNLKVLEAGVKGCALICSPVECYTDTVPDDVVTYCKSVKDWKEAIKKHKDIDYTQEQGKKLHAWVEKNYNLDTINKKRLELLTSIIPNEEVVAVPVT